MRTNLIVVMARGFHGPPRLGQPKKPVPVGTFVQQTPNENFRKGMLDRFPWRDESEIEAIVVSPLVECFSGLIYLKDADDLLLRDSALPHYILLGNAFPVRILSIYGSPSLLTAAQDSLLNGGAHANPPVRPPVWDDANVNNANSLSLPLPSADHALGRRPTAAHLTNARKASGSAAHARTSAAIESRVC